MDGVHVVGGRVGGSEGRKSPSGVQGQSPPEAEAKCEISVHFLTFPV